MSKDKLPKVSITVNDRSGNPFQGEWNGRFYKSHRFPEGYRIYINGKSVIIDSKVHEELIDTYPTIISYGKGLKEKMFRFKTEQEFMEEFGDNWRTEVGWIEDMNQFFGTKIIEEYQKECRNLRILARFSYIIEGYAYSLNKKMLTNEPLPDREELRKALRSSKVTQGTSTSHNYRPFDLSIDYQVGDIIKFEDDTYLKVVEDNDYTETCEECFFYGKNRCSQGDFKCHPAERKDKNFVHLEKTNISKSLIPQENNYKLKDLEPLKYNIKE